MFEKLFEFEAALAEFTGAPYVVVTDGCTHAIELCFRYTHPGYCKFPAHTYLSIPQLMKNMHIDFDLSDEEWVGEYRFHNTHVWDSARLLQRGMYRFGMMQCLSFGHGKPLQLGKGGAVLLDDKHAYEWLSRARSDGRDLRISPWESQKTFEPGWHYCPTLETCEEGIKKLPFVDQEPKYYQYPDLRDIDITI